MTQPKRLDEVALYTALRTSNVPGVSKRRYIGPTGLHEVTLQLGMHPKRVQYLLTKWSKRGWLLLLDPETNWVGVFTENAPAQIQVRES